MATDETDQLARLTKAYAKGRRARVLAELVPVAGFVMLLSAASGLRAQVLFVSALALLLATIALWRGESVGRAVYPGLLVGVVPFVCSFAGGHLGHVCTGDACMSLCMPLCATGGALAGLLVARVALREPHLGHGVVMGALALAVGSLGCPHAGFASLASMGLGLVVPLACARLGRRTP